MIINAENALSSNLDINLNVDKVLEHVRALDSLSLHFVESNSSRGGTILQRSSRKTESLLPVAPVNILIHCYSFFCANAPLSRTNRDLETSVLREGMTGQRLNIKIE